MFSLPSRIGSVAADQTDHCSTVGKDGDVNPLLEFSRNNDPLFSKHFFRSEKHVRDFPELLSLLEVNAMTIRILPAFVWIVFISSITVILFQFQSYSRE